LARSRIHIRLRIAMKAGPVATTRPMRAMITPQAAAAGLELETNPPTKMMIHPSTS